MPDRFWTMCISLAICLLSSCRNLNWFYSIFRALWLENINYAFNDWIHNSDQNPNQKLSQRIFNTVIKINPFLHEIQDNQLWQRFQPLPIVCLLGHTELQKIGALSPYALLQNLFLISHTFEKPHSLVFQPFIWYMQSRNDNLFLPYFSSSKCHVEN